MAPELRCQGLGRQLHNSILESLRQDAKHAGKQHLDYVFCEINDPQGEARPL